MPSVNLKAIAHLSPEDQKLFIQYGFGAEMDVPFGCVHHAFAHHAAAQPSAIAVEHIGESITYGDLDIKSSRLARRLQSSGVHQGSRVVLLAERSIPFVIGILAILKAGAAYVPLDGGIVTDSTLGHVIIDSESSVTLAMKAYTHRPKTGHVLCLEDAIAESESTELASEPLVASKPTDGVYVIYTSGTTGKPKGVDVMHYNVTNLVCLPPGNLGMRPGLRVSQFLNISFDMAQWETLGSMANGATLCIRGRTSREWKAVMKTVDIVVATPSIMVPHDPADYPNIKVIATAGEVCPQALADKWGKTAKFHNSCGPTEITIVNTVQPHTSGYSLSIGTPTPNNTVYILDEDLKPVPIGEPGVMWAGGRGITRGYINLPEKTAERYRLDPFANDGSFMFNTGDLGRWRPDGQLDCLGRIDDQVKVKGFRVELDGVSAAMRTAPGVSGAVAVLIGQELWGFATPSGVNYEQIRDATAKVQPYYAVPTKYLSLDDFPTTANGKIDKRVLKAMAEEKLAKGEEAMHTPAPANIKPVAAPAAAPAKKMIEPMPMPMPMPIPAALKPAAGQGLVFAPLTKKRDLLSPGQTIHNLSAPLHEIIVAPARVEATYQSEKMAPDSMAPAAAPPMTRQSSSSGSSATDIGSMKGKTDSIGDVEKAKWWDGYLDDELPQKTQGKQVRNIRHQIFSLYRRLFGIIFVSNLALFIATVAKQRFDSLYLGKIVVANLFCAILMRQEYVVNAFFAVFCAVPSSWPLLIRRICARVYHIGGLHSGSGASGTLWVVLLTARVTIEATHGRVSIITAVFTWLILAELCTIVVLAYPILRTRFHDRFEKSHRFLGWTATAIVWVQSILLINDYRLPGETLGYALVHSAPFWLVVIFTVSIILPWLKLRKVPVRSVILSSHAVRLYFDYVTPISGSYTRISHSPLFEWHSFATIPEPGKTGYSLVVSRAGDWTSDLIENPPTEMWVRGIPTMGVLRIVPLFRRMVFVATGSGIGPCAPCILEQKVPIRLLWTAPNVRQTFGDDLVDSLIRVSPGAVIYDTRTHGKPDMVRLTLRLVREFDAEAVAIISNQKLTQKVVYGLTARGIPCYGAIWDS